MKVLKTKLRSIKLDEMGEFSSITSKFNVYILLSLLVLVQPKNTSSIKEIESASDEIKPCPTDQVYVGSPEFGCRNCSFVEQLLSTNLEYRREAASELRRPNPEQQQSPSQSSQSSRVQAGKLAGLNKPTSISKVWDADTIRFGDTGSAVLSRLISTELQDESEYGDTSAQYNLGESSSPEFSGATSGADIYKTSALELRRLVLAFARSGLMETNLLAAIHNCKVLKNSTGCQTWSNLCVLSMYSHSDVPSQEPMPNSRSREESESDRASSKSWQDCSQYGANSACNSLREWHRVEKKSIAASDDLTNIFADDEALTKSPLPSFKLGQPLQLIAYKYSLDGILISVDQFDLGEIRKFCLLESERQLDIESVDRHIKMGTNMELNCRFSDLSANLNAIRHTNETVFIDLSIGYSLGGTTFVKPVPILIKNLLFNDVQVNRKYAKDPSRWKLVRRFFFHTSLELDNAHHGTSLPETIVFIKSSDLEFRFRRHEKGIAFASILLTLDYAFLPRLKSEPDIQPEDGVNQTQTRTSINLIETSSSVRHILVDMHSYKKDLDLTVTILALLSCIWSLIRCYNIQKSHGVVRLDIGSLFRFTVIACNTLANLFLAVTFAYLVYLFSSYKFSFGGLNLAPSEELDETLILYLKISFGFKIIGIMHELHIRISADTFFIDWEKPKMLTSNQMMNYQLSQISSQLPSKMQAPVEQARQPEFSEMMRSLDQQHISFWRPYTVINCWLRMQTLRRQNLTIQLLLFVCIVEITSLANLASLEPGFSLARSEGAALHLKSSDQLLDMRPKMSPSFRALILASIYAILSIGQVLYRRYIHEPMVKDIVHEFVDMCSVANVSLFSMLFPRFGYYIHGRNANGSSDCSLSEMNALLEREERDLCSTRGLAPNSDQQTFTLILPRIINDHYRKLLSRADLAWHSKQYRNQNLAATDGNDVTKTASMANNLLKSAMVFSLTQSTSSSFSTGRAFVEAKLAKCRAINMFLTNFLDHGYKDIDYMIRERGKFESFLLDAEFDEDRTTGQSSAMLASLNRSNLNRQNPAIFCIDRKDSFTNLILLGIEWDLIMIELLTLLILDFSLMQSQSIIVIASFLWLLHAVFQAVYSNLARRNLVAKALLDEKFIC